MVNKLGEVRSGFSHRFLHIPKIAHSQESRDSVLDKEKIGSGRSGPYSESSFYHHVYKGDVAKANPAI
jgi:hypothetical protein